MDNGGFEGRKEQKDYKAKMEILNFEIAELQKKQLEYEKEIRYQERIIRIHKYFEAIIGITILIIYMLIRLFKY